MSDLQQTADSRRTHNPSDWIGTMHYLRAAQIEATIAADAYNKIVVSMSDHVHSLAESILEEGANQ